MCDAPAPNVIYIILDSSLHPPTRTTLSNPHRIRRPWRCCGDVVFEEEGEEAGAREEKGKDEGAEDVVFRLAGVELEEEGKRKEALVRVSRG